MRCPHANPVFWSAAARFAPSGVGTGGGHDLLATVVEPMRVRDIPAIVEKSLGRPVAYSSVKETLSAHTRGANRRFRRTRRGHYKLL